MSLTRGTRIGPYLVEALIGAGGMGEVYRARDTRLDRDVAVKVLPAHFVGDDEWLHRFEREARAASALNHPGILTVFDVGTHDGFPYLVCELLEGETLRERLARGSLPLAKAIDLARQYAAALSAVHEKGLTHRDLKPGNLFVTSDGRAKILDFGLAKQTPVSDPQALTRAQSLTIEGALVGTPGYMSPEQARGLPTDARSDIFSFGVVLYEMISGAPPFERESTIATLHAILEEDAPPVPDAVLRACPALGWIVARCLERDRAARFRAAHDIDIALSGASTPSGVAADLASPRSRRTRIGRIATWAAIAGFSLAAGAALHRRLAATELVDPPRIEPLTFSGHDASPAASPDGKTIAFVSDRDGTPRIWLKQVAGGGELALTDGRDNLPRFSPDGTSILFVRGTAPGTALYRTPLLGGDAHKMLDDVISADWSPDGRRLAFTRWVSKGRTGSVVGVADASGAGEREIAFVPGRSLTAPRWSPDGRTIAVVNELSSVATGFGIDLIDAAGAGDRLLPPAHPSRRQSSVIWTADSRSVIYSEAESVVAWMSGSSAQIIQQDVATGAARAMLWVANHSRTLDVLGPGTLLFDTRSSRENLREISLSDNASRALTHGNSTDRQPTYSPDGASVAFSSNRGGNLDIWVVNRASGSLRRVTDDPADDWDIAFASNGRFFWGSNRTGPYEVWTAASDGSNPQQVSHDGAFAQNPGQTSDGRWIIYASTGPAHPGLWRTRTDGSEPVQLVRSGALQIPDVSPDGQLVLYLDGLSSRIRVVQVRDGTPVPFTIAVERRTDTTATLGRARWMPGGGAIAFVGQDERGVNGVFVQDFVPGRDTTPTRRQLAGFDPDNSAESFAVSPDGRSVTVAGWEQMFNIFTASRIPGVERPTAFAVSSASR